MALDGVFLRQIKKELEQVAVGARVDKIYQPNKEEIVLFLRTRSDCHKLLLSVRANSPRVHFTNYAIENPKTPPMFCMLLRKKLSGAKLLEIRQPELERMLYLDFAAFNELGDNVVITLVIEIMGKYSNLVILDENEKIVDSLKRVDAEMSSKRMVLPGLKYQLPPSQDKICMLQDAEQQIILEIERKQKLLLDKAILSTLQGVSSIVCRELSYLTCRGKIKAAGDLQEEEVKRLRYFLNRLMGICKQQTGEPYLVLEQSGKPIDFTFMHISQYEDFAKLSKYETFSSLLDDFYYERDKSERMRVKSHDLRKVLTTTLERITRKLEVQTLELKKCGDREHAKRCGDIISANLYRIDKGIPYADLEDFYDKDLRVIRIPLDPRLTASQNAQKYYKAYRKQKTAEQILLEQIKEAKKEQEYIETVIDALNRSESEGELMELREELSEQGYLRVKKDKKKAQKPVPPHRFVSSDGCEILVGRNNRQNDQLTLKQARKNDIWFHVKDIPGSHVILFANGKQLKQSTLKEAAIIAAYYSKAKESSNVPVDYTLVRYVSKPQGSKPGRVIYTNQRTVFVTPNSSEIKQFYKKK